MKKSQRIRINGAHVALPSGITQTDVLISGKTIAHVGVPAGSPYDELVDASGLLLMPGVVDTHVHFREPGLTHKEDLRTGTRAAAKGGVTTIVEMPNTVPPAVTVEGIRHKLHLASQQCVTNYGFYIAASHDNIEELKNADTVALGIKVFMGSTTGNLLVDDDETLERIFAETTLAVCAHCEEEPIRAANEQRLLEQQEGKLSVADHSRIRDERCAVESTKRALAFSKKHGKRFHLLHVSTAAETEMVRDAGELVTGEACPHHLLLCTEDYERLGTRAQMNPSLKSRKDQEGLWHALREGWLQSVVTDHAPHTLEEKAKPYPESPAGIPAIENSLVLMLDAASRGLCTVEQVVQWMCAGPASVWGLDRKGVIEEGADADLTLVDLEMTRTVRDADQMTRAGWSSWNNVTLRGWPVRTYVLGREVMRDGEVIDEPAGEPVGTE